jgi:hypothetical protein
LAEANDTAQANQTMQRIPDPAGTFYRYSLPASFCFARAGSGGNGDS